MRQYPRPRSARGEQEGGHRRRLRGRVVRRALPRRRSAGTSRSTSASPAISRPGAPGLERTRTCSTSCGASASWSTSGPASRSTRGSAWRDPAISCGKFRFTSARARGPPSTAPCGAACRTIGITRARSLTSLETTSDGIVAHLFRRHVRRRRSACWRRRQPLHRARTAAAARAAAILRLRRVARAHSGDRRAALRPLCLQHARRRIRGVLSGSRPRGRDRAGPTRHQFSLVSRRLGTRSA